MTFGNSIRLRRLMLAATVLWLCNAAWLPEASGQTVLVAQRGMSQVFDRKAVDADSCTARFIPRPTHLFIDNTIPSMAAAFAAGADVVELDLSTTADGQFVAFHDFGLDCRTNGTGPLRNQSLAALKMLDVGYGYTADNGKTYPLRGRGVGLMPSLTEVLQAFSDRRFMIQLKQGPRNMGSRLAAYLDAQHVDWNRLAFFGRAADLDALRTAHPGVNIWDEKAGAKCAVGYAFTGWTGRVPKTCEGGLIVVSLAQRWLAWGWPNQFVHRMESHRMRVLVVGGADSLTSKTFWRVDSARDVARLPKDLPVLVWTDHIEVIGPLLKPSPAPASASPRPARPG